VDAIKGNLESLRLMLLQLHRREGWKALGYQLACAQRNLGNHRVMFTNCSTLRRLKKIAATGIINWINLRLFLSQLEELHKLPSEQQAEGLQRQRDGATGREEAYRRSCFCCGRRIKRPAQSTTVQMQKQQEVSSVDALPQSSLCCLKFWLMTSHSQQQLLRSGMAEN